MSNTLKMISRVILRARTLATNKFVCHVSDKVDDWDGPQRQYWREACHTLPFYAEHEGKRYCVLHYPGHDKKEYFRKALEDKLRRTDYDFRGAVFPEEFSDLHHADLNGRADFSGAIFMEGAEFSGTSFRTVNFSQAEFKIFALFDDTKFGDDARFAAAEFNGLIANFSDAEFSGEAGFADAKFKGEQASFDRAKFNGALTVFADTRFSNEELTLFNETEFSGRLTNFHGVKFSGGLTSFREAKFAAQWTSFTEVEFDAKTTYFRSTTFKGGQIDFVRAEFGSTETDFTRAIFGTELTFKGATFKDKILFSGAAGNASFDPQARVQFSPARIEKPELLSFNAVLLRPSWFINTDVRKVDFTDVKWYGMPGGPEGNIEAEVKALEERGVESPYTLLSQACRRLSGNAEENREYPLANEFYYWSMNSLRKEGWRNLGAIGTLYWALSGYGVRATRAFLVLVGICAAFAALYIVFGPPKLGDLGQALVYSLGAVARLNPEPRPTEPGLFQFLVIVEGLLGPLQIALLALAVRRKVMR